MLVALDDLALRVHREVIGLVAVAFGQDRSTDRHKGDGARRHKDERQNGLRAQEIQFGLLRAEIGISAHGISIGHGKFRHR